MISINVKQLIVMCALLSVLSAAAVAEEPIGDGPQLPDNLITQEQIEQGTLTLLEIRRIGRTIFSTPFNKLDGFGEGDCPGCRPTLGGNGTFLRVNGLDSQTCHECHNVLSTTSIPARFGVGGVGTAITNVMGGATIIDPIDGSFNGRFINTPFVFGSGGVELLAKEMTAQLQALKAEAQQRPGKPVKLVTKGVDFGVIRCKKNGRCDIRAEGIDDDLVVRPFGRKGEFSTTRQFDLGALRFHHGMQAVELVGEGVDADGDGVVDEITVGELSALAIFKTTLERSFTEELTVEANRGSDLFKSIGCADCHIPDLYTERRVLTYSFPEIETDPFANVYYSADLTDDPTNFQPYGTGVRVPLFADLKRHDMGETMCEDEATGSLHCHFTTTRLWGVADTVPYMHDGRALTLTEAILMHGGEAEEARRQFELLADGLRVDLLAFLRSLRTPAEVGDDLE